MEIFNNLKAEKTKETKELFRNYKLAEGQLTNEKKYEKTSPF